MITDNFLLFSDGQVTSANAVSTNTVDLGVINDAVNTAGSDVRDIGSGQPLYIWVTATQSVTYTSDDSGSWTVALVSDSDSALGSPTVLQTLKALDSGDAATTGTKYDFIVSPVEIPDGERYIGLSFTKEGTIANTTFSAGMSMNADKFKAYPKSANAVIVSSATSA